MPDRVIVTLLRTASSVLRALPDRSLHRAAHLAGAGLYLVQPRRRALVRENLARVCRSLASQGQGGSRVRRAARDRGALDHLVRDAFGHYLRTYLEAALAPYSAEYLAARLRVDTPETLQVALGAGASGDGGRIFLGLHLGAMELPASYAAMHGSTPVVAPMETISQPALQRYIAEARASTGVRLLPLQGAGAQLAEALRRGEAVAIVADRPVGGVARSVELFGAPARLPAGPALLALEHSVPVYLTSVRRVGWGDYAATVIPIPIRGSGEGTRGQRVARFMRDEARLFERVVAASPEQWWTSFFPIWDEPVVA